MHSTLFLAGMPWGILMPVFLIGIGMGITLAAKNSPVVSNPDDDPPHSS